MMKRLGAIEQEMMGIEIKRDNYLTIRKRLGERRKRAAVGWRLWDYWR